VTSLDRLMSSPAAASTIDRVQSVAFAVRLLPGQAEAVRVAVASCRLVRARRPDCGLDRTGWRRRVPGVRGPAEAPGPGGGPDAHQGDYRIQAKPGKRAELRSLLGSIAATHGPGAPGFLGSTVYETLDSADGLVEIAEWESAEAQATAVQQAAASGVYAPVLSS
jgi:hypothetical protein